MPEQEEAKIMDWMKKESTRGHFEHSIPEIAEGVGWGREYTVRVLERLESGKESFIQHRARAPRRKGSKKSPINYYYMKAVRDLCAREFKEA